jgi:hypothetical protein
MLEQEGLKYDTLILELKKGENSGFVTNFEKLAFLTDLNNKHQGK